MGRIDNWLRSEIQDVWWHKSLKSCFTGWPKLIFYFVYVTRLNINSQNIQARLRMVNACTLAQLLPQIRGRREGAPGSLLVLGSANVDEYATSCSLTFL